MEVPRCERPDTSETLETSMSMTTPGRVGAMTAAIWVVSLVSALGTRTGHAANVDANDVDTLQDIIVTGTRQGGMAATDSLAPIQILSGAALQQVAASPDLMSTLAQVVPSLVMQAYGEDMSGQTSQVKLRGLSPNHVLVLINGKRRHTTANLAVDLGSPFQGGAGVDLNFIPLDAIDHIEVLTDGAAAQYGTDAIAGVINIILKKNSSGGVVSGTYGNYYKAGGNTDDVSGNAGFEPHDRSYFNVTAETHNHGHSNVSAVDERIVNPATLANYPDSNIPQVANYPYLSWIEGDAEYHLKLAAYNAGITFDDGTEFYSFGTYGSKHAASYEFYRLPDKVQYTDPATGVTQYPLPFGFKPQEATEESDSSITAGLQGTVFEWHWDLASTFGGDHLNLYTRNSANAGIYAGGALTAMNFYDGSLQATQWTTTLDMNRDFDMGMPGPLNIASGLEYRRETYAIGAGVPASYLSGGAQSYAGLSPTDSGEHGRKNYAGYVDVAAKPSERLRVDAAARFENYSDFGNASVGKLSARWDVSPLFAVRGTAGNGFRAPTLAEEYYSSTSVSSATAFVQLPPNSAGGRVLGLGDGLRPEKSIDYSVGFVLKPLPALNVTLDLYQITLTNRIVGSGSLVGSNFGTVQSPAINAAIAANGNQLDPDVVAGGLTGINVFTNGVDTRTRGADLTVAFPIDYDSAHVTYTVGATYDDTAITGVRSSPVQLAGQSLFGAEVLSELTTASPRYVVNLGALLTYGNWTVNLLEKIYGPTSDYESDDGDNPASQVEYFKSTIGVTPITNLYLAYQLTPRLRVSIGANNLFDRLPPLLNHTLLAHVNSFAYGDNAGVVQYPLFTPYGINGGFYFAKVTCTF